MMDDLIQVAGLTLVYLIPLTLTLSHKGLILTYKFSTPCPVRILTLSNLL